MKIRNVSFGMALFIFISYIIIAICGDSDSEALVYVIIINGILLLIPICVTIYKNNKQKKVEQELFNQHMDNILKSNQSSVSQLQKYLDIQKELEDNYNNNIKDEKGEK